MTSTAMATSNDAMPAAARHCASKLDRPDVVALLALKVSFCFTISNDCFQKTNYYYQHLQPGKTYYVSNSCYSNASMGQQYSKWTVESDYRIRLTCNNFNIPAWNSECNPDRLNVFYDVNNPTSYYYYCGNEPFKVESTGTSMIIELLTNYDSSWSWFLCELQVIDEIGNNNCICGWKKTTKIVGGKETGVNEYPMMAGLVDINDRILFCGATIISEKYVLTATHCVYRKNVNNIVVDVGEHDITTGSETNATRLYAVSRFYPHPFYNDATLENDIAIVEVKYNITFSIEVGPVCLPFQHHCDSFAGNYVDLLGWGMLDFGGEKSNTLQKVTVSVLTNQDCRQKLNDSVSDKQLCTYGNSKDACQFDSGGPILWQNPTTKRQVLAGIISFGVGCAGDKPGVDTRVGKYIDWILEVTGGGNNYCKSE